MVVVRVVDASVDVLWTKSSDLHNGINTFHPPSVCCTIPHLNTLEGVLLSWKRLNGESPPVLCMCERRTVEEVWTQFFRVPPQDMSKNSFTVPLENVRRLSGVQCMSESVLWYKASNFLHSWTYIAGACTKQDLWLARSIQFSFLQSCPTIYWCESPL